MRRKNCMDGCLGQFLRQSTLHGAKYIGSQDKHPCEKFFWMVAVLIGFAGAAYMVAELVRKYKESPVIIAFQPKETTVAQIPFPAVTICNVNILKALLMQKVVNTLVDDIDNYNKNRTGKSVKRLLTSINLAEHMMHFCLAAPSLRRTLNATIMDALGNTDMVGRVHDVILDAQHQLASEMQSDNFTETPEFKQFLHDFRTIATHHCEDMILKCMWSRKLIPCKKLFRGIRTQYGSCCVYNLMPRYILRKINETDIRAIREAQRIPVDEQNAWSSFTADDMILKNGSTASSIKYPQHQKAGGKPYGLSLLINPEVGTYSSCSANDGIGFKVIAHSPISFPSIMEHGLVIPRHTESFVNIEPELTTAEEKDLKDIDIEKRSCYFPSDDMARLTSYKFYTASNCIDECIAEKTYDMCNCVRYFMPRNSTQKLCGAKMLKCSEDVRKNLTENGRKGQCSECKPACTEVKYKMHISHFPLREYNSSLTFPSSIENNQPNQKSTNHSIVHIFMGTDYLYAKERKRLFDTFDLIASAGGLLSLALGVSILSLVELLFFFTLRVWFQRKHDREQNEEEEDDDFYSRSSGGERRHSSTVKPRIMDGLQTSNQMTRDYYSWAMTATSNATTIMNVKSKDNHALSNQVVNRRRIPTFQLLSRASDGQETPKLFYLS